MRALSPLLGLCLALTLSGHVQATEMPYGQSVTNGFRNQAKVAYVNPPKDAKALGMNTPALADLAKQILDDLYGRNNSKALLVVRNGSIVYERYRFGVGRQSTPLGYSVSKSLTALTVGRALCDGHIQSIDDPIKRYVPALSGTSWGEASVKHVLRMTSGAYRTDLKFDGHKSQEMQMRVGTAISGGTMSDDFVDLMRSNDERSFPAGSVFNYSNFDTVALGLLVQGATGMPFHAYFEKAIWQPMGAQAPGAWFVNKGGQTSTYNGFSATPHDWARLGVMVLEALRNPDSCFGKYLSEATSHQVASTGAATSYGYQIWVGCRSAQTDFCFVGFGGQYLLFHVASQTLVYHHATSFSQVLWLTPRVMDALIPALASLP